MVEDFSLRFNKAREIKDKGKRISEQYKVLYDLTTLQDWLQLNISPINESTAISNNMINDANAIILEISKWRGDIKTLVDYSYLFQKVKSLINDWNTIVHDYNVTQGTNLPLLIIKEKREFPEPITDEKILAINKEEVFRDFVFDRKERLWKKKMSEII